MLSETIYFDEFQLDSQPGRVDRPDGSKVVIFLRVTDERDDVPLNGRKKISLYILGKDIHSEPPPVFLVEQTFNFGGIVDVCLKIKNKQFTQYCL